MSCLVLCIPNYRMSSRTPCVCGPVVQLHVYLWLDVRTRAAHTAPGPHSISSLTPPTLDTATGTKAETRDTGPGPGTAAGVRLAHWDRADTRPRPERADSGYCRAMPGPSIIQVIVGAASAWCTAHHDTGPHAPVTVSRTVNSE